MSGWLTPLAVLGYVAYGLGFAFWEARKEQINWKYTSLGPLSFVPSYRARDFVALYFTNAVAIIASLGLLTPWAAVRTYRYRVEHLAVEQHGTLAGFVGTPVEDVRATGAEVMDLFDFDISL